MIEEFQKILLIGQRGTGKSTLLRRWNLPDYQKVDLDREIEIAQGQSIMNIFENEGETEFRRLESEALGKFINSPTPQVIAVGAGHSGELPSSALKIWVRRQSDEEGRIFFNRPKLSDSPDELQEYLERAAKRNSYYAQNADLIWTQREGVSEVDECEDLWWSRDWSEPKAIMTLLPRHLRQPRLLKYYPVRYWELRDDLLTTDEIQQASQWIDRGQMLYSARKNEGTSPVSSFRDWAIELGACPNPSEWSVLSCHEPNNLNAFLEQEKRHEFAKLALPIESFEELEKWDQWRCEAPERRSFLPMSNAGRWKWYRMRFQQPLQFISDGLGSAVDQPTLLQWLGRKPGQEFAAILGSPVEHSWTPIFHRNFFRCSIFSIDVQEKEWSLAYPLLKKWGLVAAAITSPLKRAAFDQGFEFEGEADLKSVNTLLLSQTTNTDAPALREWLGQLKDVAVWGGGGLLPTLQSIFPDADFYSARSGELRQGTGRDHYTHVIWASGPKGTLPKFRGDQVWDLSYQESSMGRQFARNLGVEYQSGETLFRLQAQLQQQFWRLASEKTGQYKELLGDIG